MEKYLKELGVDITDIKVDKNNKIYIEIVGKDEDGFEVYKEINLPEEYQTIENVNLIKHECVGCKETQNLSHCDGQMCHKCWVEQTEDYERQEIQDEE